MISVTICVIKVYSKPNPMKTNIASPKITHNEMSRMNGSETLYKLERQQGKGDLEGLMTMI